MALSRSIRGLKLLQNAAGMIPVPFVGPALSSAVAAAISVGELVEKSEAAQVKLRNLVEEATGYLETITKRLQNVGERNPDSLQQRTEEVQDLSDALVKILKFAEKNKKKPRKRDIFMKTLSGKDQAEEVDKLRRDFEVAKSRLELGLSMQQSSAIDDIHRAVTKPGSSSRVQYIYEQDPLHVLYPILQARYSYQDSNRTGCLPRTRVDVLDRIYAWATDEDESAVFCLTGLAGSGKSTIAHTVCEHLAAPPRRLGASYFFSRDEEERRNKENVVRTLAHQLSLLRPLKQLIVDAVEKHADIAHKVMREQVLTLFAGPLSQAKGLPSPLVIVLDAVDECEECGGDLIPLLVHTFRSLLPGVRVKLLITSRSSPELENKLFGIAHTAFQLHEVERSAIDADIRTFLAHHFKSIARKHVGMVPAAWPAEENLSAIIERSGGLFVFASTVVNYVSLEGSPESRLLDLIATTTTLRSTEGQYKHLDELYLKVLEAAGLSGRSETEWYSYVKRVAGSVVLMQNPLPEGALVRLLNYQLDTTQAALHSLNAVVVIPKNSSSGGLEDATVRVFHPSFSEFITDPKRCVVPQFYVSKPQHYAVLCRRCLIILNTHLRTDMCNIRNPSLLNSELSLAPVLPQVAFSCKFWIDSLLRTETYDDELVRILKKFCEKHILHWIELCSLIGALKYVLNGLHRLCLVLKEKSECERPYLILRDAERLLLEFFTPISECALQTYYTSQPLVPDCPLLDVVSENPDNSAAAIPFLLTPRSTQWDARLTALEGHSSPIKHLSISSDGTKLAGGTQNGSICIYDPWAGQVSMRLPETTTGPTRCSAFTPDGRYLVSASGGVLRVWNAITADLEREFPPYRSSIGTLSISPDGNQLVSGSNDGSVCLWDFHTGEIVETLSESETAMTRIVLYSKDGSHLFCGYAGVTRADFAISIWDVRSRLQIGTLEGHTKAVNDLALSEKNQLLISGGSDCFVRVWDIALRKQVMLLEGHSGYVHTVSVIGNGSRCISGDSHGDIRLWSLDSGACLTSFHGHTKHISGIAVFPDGSRFCSSAEDGTLLVWSTDVPDTSRPASTMRALQERARKALKLSAKDDTSADGRQDGSIQIKRLDSSDPPQELAPGSDPIRAKSRQYKGVPQGLMPALKSMSLKPVTSLSFSSDGSWLVSTNSSCVTHIWDVLKGEEVAAFEDTSHAALFPDKSRIAVTPKSFGGIIRILSTKDAQEVWKLSDSEHSRNPISTMKVSTDGTLLLSISSTDRCCVWNVVDGSQLTVFQRPAGALLAFTPDSQRIVAYELGDFTTVWDVKNGTPDEYEEPPFIEGESIHSLFYITKKGWVCGPTSPYGSFRRLLWLPQNRRTKECWFHEGVLTSISSSGSITQLDIKELLDLVTAFSLDQHTQSHLLYFS